MLLQYKTILGTPKTAVPPVCLFVLQYKMILEFLAIDA